MEQFSYSYKEMLKSFRMLYCCDKPLRIQSSNNMKVERRCLNGRKGHKDYQVCVWGEGRWRFPISNNTVSGGLDEKSGI